MDINFVSYFDKFNLKKIKTFFKLGIIFLLIFLILLNINLYQNKFDKDSKNSFGFSNCTESPLSYSLVSTENTNVEKIEISIFPEVKNLFCIGSIVDYKIDSDGNKTSYIATSSVASNYFLILVNATLCLYVVLFSTKKKYKLLLIFYVSNFLCNLIFSITILEACIKTIFPIINPEGEINNVVFQNLFLILLVIKNKNNKTFILGLFYFIFVSIDFLGFFFILYFLNSNFKINFNKKEEIVLYSAPVIFYFIRIITSFLKVDFYSKGTTLLDFLWINSGQRIYRGFSRYADMEATLFGFQCNISNESIYPTRGTNLNCLDNYLRMGPSGELISFSGNIEVASLIIMNIFLLFLILFYIYGLKSFKKYNFVIFLFVMSPPLNFVTFLGNVDFIIFVLLLIFLRFFSKNYYLLGTFLFLLSAFKIHPVGGLFGLIIYSIYIKNRNLFYFNFLLGGLFLYFILGYETDSDLELVYWSNVGLNYGFLNDSLVINNYFGLNSIVSFISVLTLSYFLFRKLNLQIFKIKESSTIGLPISFIFIFIFWFIETNLYTNNTYRLSIFSLLFVTMFINADKKVKLLILLAIFLEPTLLFENKIFELLIGFFNSLSINILFMYLIKSFVYSFTNLKLSSYLAER